MKNLFFLLLMAFACNLMHAQTTVTLRLDTKDEDAVVADWDLAVNTNYPDDIEYVSRGWTISGTPVVWRSYFKFNLQCIPSNATITSANLSLFWADTNSFGNLEHSSLSNSNESILQRVTSSWSENTLTWNNQPGTTATDQVILTQSIGGTQDYLNNDVTAMVQQMVSGANNGFLIRLNNESNYAQLFFASGDNPHIQKHPTLTITYTVPEVTCLNFTLNGNDEDAGVAFWGPALNTNYPDDIEYVSRGWTISGTPVIWRSFFKFNLQCIPSNAAITSAKLSLFWADTNSFGNLEHSSLTNSNESILQRVTSSWSENTITWNNQPGATATDQVILTQSTGGTQDYLNNDVKAMVQQMVSGANNGFLIRLNNESNYAQLFFASGDNPHINKHPQLRVCYSNTTGLTQVLRDNDIRVFPIPANDELTISATHTTHDLSVEMYTVTGVKINNWNGTSGNKEVTIHTSFLKAGIYFVKVFDGERYTCKKVIIEHD